MIFKNALPRDIHITGSSNGGFILQCGCCTVVFTDKKEMCNAILDYINDPEKMEKEYNKSLKNLAMGGVQAIGTLRTHHNPCAEVPMSDECCEREARRY